MEQKKRLGLGGRGWLLLIYQFIAFMAYTVFTNYPLNILSQQFDPMADAQTANQEVSLLYTLGAIVGIIVQLILSQFVGRMKSVKNFGLALGAIAIALAFCVALIPMNIGGQSNIIWGICYFLINVFITMWCTFAIGILIGQWFPTRKGTVMGIATISFPLANALIGTFANTVMNGYVDRLNDIFQGGDMSAIITDGLAGHDGQFVFALDAVMKYDASYMTVFWGFLPFLIITVVAWLIGAIAIKDYPEQCGAYRDNDRSLTPEIATQMMLAEIENKKNSSWKIGRVFTSRDYWFVTIPMGALLMFSVGMMTQTQNILSSVGIVDDNMADFAFNLEVKGFTIVMIIVAIFGAVGSFILGLLDTKFGTKKSIIIATFFMLAAGIIGVLSGYGVYQNPLDPNAGFTWTSSAIMLMIALFALGVFMGASSNYTVSAAAQYWRREDFGNVFGAISPVANVLAQLGPIVIALLAGIGATELGGVSGTGIMCVFGVTLAAGVISLICILLFSPKHVKVVDDKYRTKDGKPLDDALVGRK